jgi:hypothetical protein
MIDGRLVSEASLFYLVYSTYTLTYYTSRY